MWERTSLSAGSPRVRRTTEKRPSAPTRLFVVNRKESGAPRWEDPSSDPMDNVARSFGITLVDLEASRWTPRERDALIADIKDEISLLWLTGELRECDPQLCGWVGGPQIGSYRTSTPGA